VKLTGRNIHSFALPFVFVLFTVSGFVESILTYKNHTPVSSTFFMERGEHLQNAGRFNILSENDLVPNVLDTVLTDKDCWLELRVDQQKLYQHWRNGQTEVFPVSTGNPNGGPEALESRPGLFAIFMKVEHHISSQFNSANMYHFMPFNQGIGFHSIDGTGYYSHLGVRPSSHGCIRMKHKDAEKLFEDCPLGTLVLVSKGRSARTIAFAPREFKNEVDYTKDDFRWMLAKNLKNLLTGNFFVEKRDRFVIDPTVIPKSGVYNGYNARVPERQNIPRSFASFREIRDNLDVSMKPGTMQALDKSIISASETKVDEAESFEEEAPVEYDNEVIKEYFSNPIGVLPYFGPKK
jgi:hypothetical protein